LPALASAMTSLARFRRCSKGHTIHLPGRQIRPCLHKWSESCTPRGELAITTSRSRRRDTRLDQRMSNPALGRNRGYLLPTIWTFLGVALFAWFTAAVWARRNRAEQHPANRPRSRPGPGIPRPCPIR
jgi:hypothetical protein